MIKLVLGIAWWLGIFPLLTILIAFISYCFQMWNPHSAHQMNLLEHIQYCLIMLMNPFGLMVHLHNFIPSCIIAFVLTLTSYLFMIGVIKFEPLRTTERAAEGVAERTDRTESSDVV